MSDNADLIIDMIARAIYEGNDSDILSLEDSASENNPDGLDWYRREAVQVLEVLREAGLDIVDEFDAVVNVPLPPISLVRNEPRRKSFQNEGVPEL